MRSTREHKRNEMPSLEETIRDIVARGELTHFSLTPSQGGRMWRASFTPASTFGNTISEDADPIKALMMAFTTTKMKRRPPSDRDLAAMEATATGKIEQETVEVEPVAEADDPMFG